MTDLPVDEREWGVPFLRKRAEWHAEESAKLKALTAPHRDALGALVPDVSIGHCAASLVANER